MFRDSMETDAAILVKYLKFYISLDPLIGDIPTQKKLHSGGIIYKSDEEKLEVPLNLMSSIVYLQLDDVYDFNLEKVCVCINQFAQDMLSQMTENMLNTLTQVTDFTGNVVDGKGKSVDEAFLEMLEKIYMDFDAEGNPQLPSMIGPDVVKFIEKLNGDASLKTKYDEIIKKKREAYYAEKGCRGLSRID